MGELISGRRRLALSDMQARAARAASGLASLGIRKGDLIALYLRNDFPFIEASTAAGLLGVYATPVNWHYTPDEAAYLFENSGAKAIVIHADLIAPIASATSCSVGGLPVLRSRAMVVRSSAFSFSRMLRGTQSSSRSISRIAPRMRAIA